MGLLKGLVMLPLAPAMGAVWVAKQVQAQAEREMFSPEGVMTDLARLQQELDEGLIAEEEYLEVEDELLDRLDALRNAQ